MDRAECQLPTQTSRHLSIPPSIGPRHKEPPEPFRSTVDTSLLADVKKPHMNRTNTRCVFNVTYMNGLGKTLWQLHVWGFRSNTYIYLKKMKKKWKHSLCSVYIVVYTLAPCELILHDMMTGGPFYTVALLCVREDKVSVCVTFLPWEGSSISVCVS